MINLQIYIVPTYKCNLKCKNCYSRKYLGEFPDHLSWAKFIEIFTFFKDKYHNFAFIGGEPTKWKFINESILFLNNKNKYVSIFTNGTLSLNAMPNNLILNGNNLFNPKLKDKIIKNLLRYKENNVKIRLRFNIDEDFSKDNSQEAVSLSVEYANSVSLSLLYPIIYSKHLGDIIFNLSNELISESIPVKISRGTPLCLFNTMQRKYLIENCKLKGKCALPTNSLVINPDGQTIQPCVELQLRRDISKLLTSSPKILFSQEIKNIKSNRRPRCSDCHFFSDECWGGCLSYNDVDDTTFERQLSL